MSRITRFTVATLTLCGLAAATAQAAEVRASFSAIERLLVSSVLKQGGRLYLEGGPEDRCRYAFVQEPKVSGSSGRLVIHFVFSGRAGAQVAGRCVGPGDTIALSVSGVPAYAGGELQLQQLRLEAPESVYYKLIAGMLQGQLEKRLRFPLRSLLEQGLAGAAAGAPVGLALSAFDVRSVAVEEEGLRLVFDGTLTTR